MFGSLWHNLRSRDTWLTEATYTFVMLCWGVLLIGPEGDYLTATKYALMRDLLPRPAWGAVMLCLFVFGVVVLLRDRHVGRQVAAILMSFVYLIIFWSFLLTSEPLPGVFYAATMAGLCLLVALRLIRKTHKQTTDDQ